MKHVLVMGAGMVARPAVTYLLGRGDLTVTVTDVDGARAQALVAGSQRGTALAVDARDLSTVEPLLKDCDICVSLLPSPFEPGVWKLALANGKHFVSASPRRDAGLEGADEVVRAAGLTFLPETGLDPGLDHMIIARMRDGIQRRGGIVTSCSSYCGGLPAPEAATNPLNYKFSWNPIGVLHAARESARYLENEREVVLPGDQLFTRHWFVSVPGFGELEAHYNRDAIPYIGIYGLHGVQNMLRATLRYAGWSHALGKLGRLGYLDMTVMDAPPATYADLTRRLSGAPAQAELVPALARALDVDPRSDAITCITWLGLTGADPIVWDAEQPHTPLEALANKMREKLMFAGGERDVCVMQNELEARYPSGEQQRWTSTLLAYGEPGGDSGMARTVGLTAAIAAALILDGRITDRGVLLPVTAAIYDPVLEELEEFGIAFKEGTETLPTADGSEVSA